MCSVSEKHYFVLEYLNYTLAEEIEKRRAKDMYFTTEEALTLMQSYIEAVLHVRQVSIPLERSKGRTNSISNSLVFYTLSGLRFMDSIYMTEFEAT